MIILFVITRSYVQCSRIGLDPMSVTPYLERKRRTIEVVSMYPKHVEFHFILEVTPLCRKKTVFPLLQRKMGE